MATGVTRSIRWRPHHHRRPAAVEPPGPTFGWREEVNSPPSRVVQTGESWLSMTSTSQAGMRTARPEGSMAPWTVTAVATA
jgi:hypothetical protein